VSRSEPSLEVAAHCRSANTADSRVADDVACGGQPEFCGTASGSRDNWPPADEHRPD